MSLSKMLVERRNELAISLRDLSEQTGLSHTFIRDIEKEKYAPSLQNAVKLAVALDLNLQEVIIKTFQFRQRQALMELLTVCHEHHVEIPYSNWVRSSLPIEPLCSTGSRLHDAALQVSQALYQEADSTTAAKKLSCISEIASAAHEDVVYDILPTVANTLNVWYQTCSEDQAKLMTRRFFEVLNNQIVSYHREEEDTDDE